MNIRFAKQQDAAALVEFNQAMALETEGKRLDHETIARGVAAVLEDAGKGFYVVADDGDNGERERICGGLMITFEWSDWRAAWFWWIQSVYILPEARGRKIYSKLYAFVKDEARARENVCGVRLYVERENTNAQAIYERLEMRRSHYLMYEEML